MKKALITGVTGQYGSYLAELLLDKGYDVHGVIRRSSVDYRERIAHLEDSMSLMAVIGTVRPDEIYNLAAQSHVQVSFDVPEFTADIDATGVLRVLEAVRLCGLAKTCRVYQASTSERKYPIPSIQPLCCCQAIWFLDYQGIPGGLWYVCLLRYFI